MLDHEFSAILGKEADWLEREGSVELSRLVCRPNLRAARGEPHPMEFLLKLLYRTSRDRGFTAFYIVVEENWIRPFARLFGLPFRVIGAPYTFSDGTRTVVATATMSELEAGMLRHSQEKYEWYRL